VVLWIDRSPFQALVLNNAPGVSQLLASEGEYYFGNDEITPISATVSAGQVMNSVRFGVLSTNASVTLPTGAVNQSWLDVIYDDTIYNTAWIARLGGPVGTDGRGPYVHYTSPMGYSPIVAGNNVPITVFVVWSKLPSPYANNVISTGNGFIAGGDPNDWYIGDLSGYPFFGNPTLLATIPSKNEGPTSYANGVIAPDGISYIGVQPNTVFVDCYVSNGTVAAAYVNLYTFTENPSDASVVGYRFCLGSFGDSFVGDLYEVLIYNQALTLTQIAAVTNYLSIRWGATRATVGWVTGGSASLILHASSNGAKKHFGASTAQIILHPGSSTSVGWAVSGTGSIILHAACRGPLAIPVSGHGNLVLHAAASGFPAFPVSGAAEIILTAESFLGQFCTATIILSATAVPMATASATIIFYATALTPDRSTSVGTATIILSARCTPNRPAPSSVPFLTVPEPIRPVRRRQPYVHGPLPYAVFVQAQGLATIILGPQAGATAIHVLPASCHASIILTPFGHCTGDATTDAECILILRARAANVFPLIDYGDDYLGRFQQGQEVPLWTVVRDQHGQPADPTVRTPWARIYDLDTQTLAASPNLARLRYSRVDQVYSLALLLDEGYPVGRYGILYEAPTGGFIGVTLAVFEVVPGGDPSGPVIATQTIARSTGDIVLGHLGDGSLVAGSKPSIS
jgi:hypothetical protein